MFESMIATAMENIHPSPAVNAYIAYVRELAVLAAKSHQSDADFAAWEVSASDHHTWLAWLAMTDAERAAFRLSLDS